MVFTTTNQVMGVVIFAMFWHSDSVIVERIVPILPLLFQMKAHKG